MLTGFTITVQRRSRRWVRTGRGPMFINEPSIRAGEAREAIRLALLDAPDAPWKANPSITRRQAAAVLEAALPSDPDEPLPPLHAANVLRLLLRRKSVRGLRAPC